MWTSASFRANVMSSQRLPTPSPREWCMRSTFAFLAFFSVLLSCLTLFGVGEYSPLEQIIINTSFHLPRPQSNLPTSNHARFSRINGGQIHNINVSANANLRTQIPQMCTDIFSIGKTRSDMSPEAKSMVSYLGRVKSNRRSKWFLRHEPYFILGDMVPVMVNITKKDNGTEVKRNKVWRMEQVDGLFPHLSCRLRQYSTAMLKQCLVNRRSRGKGTKLLFMGDSRVRQYVEVFLDVFRDMEFDIITHEGIVISVDEFLSLDASVLWTKYKKTFIARSKMIRGFEIEFYWTKIFNLKVNNVHITSESQNGNVSAVLEFLKAEDIAKGIGNVTHDLYHKALKEMRKEANISAEKKSPKLGESSPESVTGKQIMNSTFVDINNRHLKPPIIGDLLNSSSDTAMVDSVKNLNATLKVDVPYNNLDSPNGSVPPTERDLFESKPLEKLENLFSLQSTEVPDIVILGSNVWGVDNTEPILRVLDEVTLRQVAQLRPLLLRLNTITQLVWVMPTPVKDHMYRANARMVHYTNVFMKNIEWIANAQVQLMAQGITVWDSFFPIAAASVKDCVEAYLHGDAELPPHPRLGFIKSWMCGDRIHNNNEAVVEAVRMMVNQLCNEYMLHEGYCCEQ